jgi:hypothetical protein
MCRCCSPGPTAQLTISLFSPYHLTALLDPQTTRSFCRLANQQRSTRFLYSLGLDHMSSHRRRLLWTLAHFLSVPERLARTYSTIQHWHAVPDLYQQALLCQGDQMIGICLSSGLFVSFSSRRCIFLCLLIPPSALNDHHPGERGRNSLFWSSSCPRRPRLDGSTV